MSDDLMASDHDQKELIETPHGVAGKDGRSEYLFIFGSGDGSDYFDGGNGWTDTIQLEDFTSGGWTLEVDDISKLTFVGVDKIEW